MNDPAHPAVERVPAGEGHARAVGVRQPLIDGVEKVTGRARYTADLEAPGALVGAILRSPVAHGEIHEIDVEAARALPGVRAVITGDDCDIAYGVIPVAQNEFPLARGRVRYRGEPIAAVAADDEATARAALELIHLDIEPLPALLRRGVGARGRRDAAPPEQGRATSSGRSTRRSATSRADSPRPTSCARRRSATPR